MTDNFLPRLVRYAATFGLALTAIAFAADEQPTAPGKELESLRQEIQELKEGQGAIQKQLGEIKQFLQAARQQAARPPGAQPIDAIVPIDKAPTKGQADAKLVLVEFSDYQCPFCQRSFQSVLPQVDKDYIQTGKLKYVFQDFPLEELHKNAFKAAEAAHCAGDQGKYWEMHDRLFSNQQALAPENLTAYAESLGLNRDSFQQCLDSDKYAAQVREDMSQGQQLGVQGTPTFFLGTATADGKVKAVRVLRGALPYPAFKEAIDGLLASGS
ncbi:MAG: DsbA family protein [Candidatus Competibacteraceae bacterium]